MSNPATCDPGSVCIPPEVVELLRATLARALDRGDTVTDDQRHIARVELVGALDFVLNGVR